MTEKLETKAPFVVLNEGQARYLIELSRAANDYRASWESLTQRGEKEIKLLDAGGWVNGPNHQIMAEIQQEYGKIKVTLDLLWSVFRVDIYAEEDREAAREEINKFLKIALGKSKGFHGTWFHEGHTISDF